MLESWGSWLPTLLTGLNVSLQLTGASLLLGIPLGLVLALLVSSTRGPVRVPALILVELGRGVPALVVLQLIYFGLPSSGLTLSPFSSATAALALNTGAYTSEILRGGLRSVPQGEVEAADALGMTYRDTMRFIVIPQGLRIALPPLLGFGILIFQSTSLAYTISLQELLSRAYSIGSSTFLYFEVLLLAGLLYLAVTLPTGWITSYLEKRTSVHVRRV